MSIIKANISVKDSFGKRERGFEKEIESDDFQKFFSEEGEYLDRLSSVLAEHGKIGDEFSVDFHVSVEKEL